MKINYKRDELVEKIKLPLSQFSMAQKIDLMEEIWSDITKDEKIFKSPAWHELVLKEREQALSQGKASVTEWEEAKERIRRNAT